MSSNKIYNSVAGSGKTFLIFKNIKKKKYPKSLILTYNKDLR